MNNILSSTSNPVADFFRYLRKPDTYRISAPARTILLFFMVIVALDILFSFTGNFISSFLEEMIQFEPEHVMSESDQELIQFMASVGIPAIPFIEEITFRLWLAPNLLFLFISLFLMTVQFAPFPTPLIGLLPSEEFAPVFKVSFYFLLTGAITLFFWIRQRRGHPYADFFQRHIAAYFYLSSIIFGLIHLTNYTNMPPLWMAPLLVAPQLVGGLIFGYIRIRMGFWWAVLAHLLTNLLFTIGDLMNVQFGEIGGFIWLIVLLGFAISLIVWSIKKKPNAPIKQTNA